MVGVAAVVVAGVVVSGVAVAAAVVAGVAVAVAAVVVVAGVALVVTGEQGCDFSAETRISANFKINMIIFEINANPMRKWGGGFRGTKSFKIVILIDSDNYQYTKNFW